MNSEKQTKTLHPNFNILQLSHLTERYIEKRAEINSAPLTHIKLQHSFSFTAMLYVVLT